MNSNRKMDEKQLRRVSRRELLKLTPVLALGAFAVPKWQEGLLEERARLQRLGIGPAIPARPSGDHLFQR